METPCVDIEILSDIIEGRISSDERRQIISHMKRCPECFMRVNSALLTCCDREIEACPPLPEKEVRSVLKRLEKKVKKPFTWHPKKALRNLIEWRDHVAADLPLVYGAARHPAEPMSQIKIDYIHIEKAFGDIKAVLLFEKYFDRFTVHIRMNHPQSDVYNNIRFNLRGEEGPVSRLLKEGHASFEDFPFGGYELVMIHKQQEKGRYHFQINNKGLLNGQNPLS